MAARSGADRPLDGKVRHGTREGGVRHYHPRRRLPVRGRCVDNNIRRFLQFQLTANVSALFVSFLAADFLDDTPFKAVP
jgi:hypothetical protein